MKPRPGELSTARRDADQSWLAYWRRDRQPEAPHPRRARAAHLRDDRRLRHNMGTPRDRQEWNMAARASPGNTNRHPAIGRQEGRRRHMSAARITPGGTIDRFHRPDVAARDPADRANPMRARGIGILAASYDAIPDRRRAPRWLAPSPTSIANAGAMRLSSSSSAIWKREWLPLHHRPPVCERAKIFLRRCERIEKSLASSAADRYDGAMPTGAKRTSGPTRFQVRRISLDAMSSAVRSIVHPENLHRRASRALPRGLRISPSARK